MQRLRKDERDLLDVLRFELQFLRDGGYGRSPRTPWRPQYIFEDSLTCTNFDSKDNPVPCSECVLMPLVPPEQRSEKIPCRHIPFNEFGENLDSLYRNRTQEEIEDSVEEWLKTTIDRLEEERKAIREQQTTLAAANAAPIKGTPLYQRQHPKCANPVCPTAFHWTGGGKFFRFRPEIADAQTRNADPEEAYAVKHYWLCERCSRLFTLVYEEEFGVAVKILWAEIEAGEAGRTASAV